MMEILKVFAVEGETYLYIPVNKIQFFTVYEGKTMLAVMDAEDTVHIRETVEEILEALEAVVLTAPPRRGIDV